MRFMIMPTNIIALPLALTYSPPLEGEIGHEFAIIIGPIYISIQWGFGEA